VDTVASRKVPPECQVLVVELGFDYSQLGGFLGDSSLRGSVEELPALSFYAELYPGASWVRLTWVSVAASQNSRTFAPPSTTPNSKEPARLSNTASWRDYHSASRSMDVRFLLGRHGRGESSKASRGQAALCPRSCKHRCGSTRGPRRLWADTRGSEG